MENQHQLRRPENFNDMLLIEREEFSDIEEEASDMGEPMDPRLISLLDFFRELYDRRNEVFEKLFPGKNRGGEFEEFLDKIREVMGRSGVGSEGAVKSRGLRRSMSIGSPRDFKGKGGEESMRLERFKVRIVNVGDDKGGGGGGNQGTGTKPTGVK